MKIGYRIIEIPFYVVADDDDTKTIKFEKNYGSEFKRLLGYKIELPQNNTTATWVPALPANPKIADVFLSVNSHKDVVVVDEPVYFENTINFFARGKKKDFLPVNADLQTNSLITGRAKFTYDFNTFATTGMPYEADVPANIPTANLKLKIYLKLERR